MKIKQNNEHMYLIPKEHREKHKQREDKINKNMGDLKPIISKTTLNVKV